MPFFGRKVQDLASTRTRLLCFDFATLIFWQPFLASKNHGSEYAATDAMGHESTNPPPTAATPSTAADDDGSDASEYPTPWTFSYAIHACPTSTTPKQYPSS